MSEYIELKIILQINDLDIFKEKYKLSKLNVQEDYELIDMLFLNQKKISKEIFLLSKNNIKKDFTELMYITLNYLISKYLILSEEDILFLIKNLKLIKTEYEKIIINMLNNENIENNILSELIKKYRQNFNFNDLTEKLNNKKMNEKQKEKIKLYLQMLDF